jgi:hypothetical protein
MLRRRRKLYGEIEAAVGQPRQIGGVPETADGSAKEQRAPPIGLDSHKTLPATHSTG